MYLEPLPETYFVNASPETTLEPEKEIYEAPVVVKTLGNTKPPVPEKAIEPSTKANDDSTKKKENPDTRFFNTARFLKSNTIEKTKLDTTNKPTSNLKPKKDKKWKNFFSQK
jgi:hypothetical protein